jgi:hypothetical protein
MKNKFISLKKWVWVAMLAFLSTAIFGQEREVFSTSDGYWSCQIQYIGKNKGQENADLFGGPWTDYTWIERLSNNQQDLIRRMLNKYQRARDDTFHLTLSYWPRSWSCDFPYTAIMVIVEYTTNTDWVYWAYNVNTK